MTTEYIVMAEMETGEEMRATEGRHSTAKAAADDADKFREDYPDMRRVWIERHEVGFHFDRHQSRYDNDEQDLY